MRYAKACVLEANVTSLEQQKINKALFEFIITTRSSKLNKKTYS